jgi:peptide/nickel transport system substrate-binding protein
MKTSNLTKKLSIVLTVILAFSLFLTACSSSSSNSSTSTPPVSSNTPAVSGDTAQPETSDDTANGPTAEEIANKSVVISLASAWTNFNPFDYGSEYNAYVRNVVFDKLVDFNKDGTISPRLLTSWEFSADRKTLTGKLAENVRWHDGEPLTAEDIVFTINLFVNPAVVTRNRDLILAGTNELGILEEGSTLGVKALDDYTIEFTFKEPTQEILFFSESGHYWVLPKHLLADADPATIIDNPFFLNPVGTGPFKFDSQIIGTEFVGKANTDYFRGAPNFGTVIVRVITNDNLLPALLSEDLDVVGGSGISALPVNDYKIAEKEANLLTKSIPHLGAQLIILNTESGPLQDVNVRKALEHAINKQSIVDNLFGGEALVLTSSTLPTSSYYNADIKSNDYDPEKAKQLLDAAGYDYNTTIRIFVPSGVTEREQSAVLIQQDFEKVGVKSEVTLMEFAAIGAALTEGFDLCLMGNTPNIAPNDWAGWYNANNTSKLKDLSIWEAYQKGDAANSVEEAKAFYGQAQQLQEDLVPLIFLYSPYNLIAHNSRVGNIAYNGYFIADNIYQWTVE